MINIYLYRNVQSPHATPNLFYNRNDQLIQNSE